MKGVVFEMNPRRGMVAVHTENNDFSVFELLGEYDIEKGDRISWEGATPLGSETVHNLTKEEELEVYFQNHWVSKNQLARQLLF